MLSIRCGIHIDESMILQYILMYSFFNNQIPSYKKEIYVFLLFLDLEKLLFAVADSDCGE